MKHNFNLYLQRHDIIKKRIDAHGNVIESRQESIGAPKVSDKIVHAGYLQCPDILYFCTKKIELALRTGKASCTYGNHLYV